MPFTLQSTEITVGARASALSCKQVQELLELIRPFCPSIIFHPHLVESKGDLDQKTSLRTLDKTDFFTYEIDQMQLRGECRIAVHSAKDLPDPLPKGLKLAAVTKCLDSRDSLVFKGAKLPQKALVATSSKNREKNVLKLYPDARFIDIRGTIEQRLAQLQTEKLDGVVIAEAALIRLNLTHLPRITLPGSTTPLQGSLAVIVRQEDHEMSQLFKNISHENLIPRA